MLKTSNLPIYKVYEQRLSSLYNFFYATYNQTCNTYKLPIWPSIIETEKSFKNSKFSNCKYEVLKYSQKCDIAAKFPNFEVKSSESLRFVEKKLTK